MNDACETHQAALVDLLYDECPADRAQRLREHLAQCADCAQAWQSLNAGRLAASEAMAEPPQAVRARVMQSLDEYFEHSRPRIEPLKLGLPWWRRLAALALRPQAAMATVVVMVLGIGLWSLPMLRSTMPESGETLAMPEGVAMLEQPATSTAPSGASPTDAPGLPAPAGRTREAEKEPATTIAAAELSTSNDALADRARAARSASAAEGAMANAEPRVAGPEVSAERAADDEAPSEAIEERDLEMAVLGRAESLSGSADTAAGEGTGGGSIADVLGGAGRGAGSSFGGLTLGSRRAEEGAAATPSSRSDAQSPAVAAAPSRTARVGDGYGSGAGAAPAARPSAPPRTIEAEAAAPGQPAVTLAGARQLAAAGRTGSAVAAYQHLISRGTTEDERGAAMVELAGIYARAGRVSEARNLAMRARSIRSARAKADALLSQLSEPRAAAAAEAASEQPAAIE